MKEILKILIEKLLNPRINLLFSILKYCKKPQNTHAQSRNFANAQKRKTRVYN